MNELSIAPVGRIIKNAGAERVSDDAKKALANFLEEYGEDISTKALLLAKHAKRVTILASDIEIATKQIG
jgi:histone H3/H4